MIFWTPVFFFLPRKEAWKICKLWAYSHLWLQHVVCGSTYDFRGLENVSPNTSQFVASKHQSAWETYTMLLFFSDPGYVLKRELTYIPLFGWYMKKMKVVPVDRGRGSLALQSMARNSAAHMRERPRQIIIYPEGTRTRPGNKPNYKYGLTHLYDSLDVPILPVALNSGLYWGRNAFTVYPGTIVMEFLKPILPGMSKDQFSRKLEEVIETASTRLNGEAAQSDNPPPLAVELALNPLKP
jgi:1-acyl-sn-glycerol-3-phosphate acyltransferase